MNDVSDVSNDVVEANQEPVQEDATQRIIEVANPSTEEMAGIVDAINVNYNSMVATKAVEFKFKKSTDKASGIETVRKPVELAIPYPSIEGIVHILEQGGKGLELLMEAMQGVVNAAARDILYDDLKGELNASTFPTHKLDWDAIASIPKVQRRGGGIPKEVWEKFAVDYCEVMPSITNKTIDQVSNAAKILVGKLQAVRTNEPVIKLLVEQLGVYAESTPNLEDFAECITFLLAKAETFLNVSDEELLANL
jgi:hypothetical protein